jgi:hypothetical protein
MRAIEDHDDYFM